MLLGESVLFYAEKMLQGKTLEILSEAFGKVTVYEVGFRGVKCGLLVPITATVNNSVFFPRIISRCMNGYFENCWNLINNGDQLNIIEIKTADSDFLVLVLFH